MDDLAINIFVPENKADSKGARKKISESPSARITEVKSSLKPVLKNKIVKTRSDRAGITKKSPLIKTIVPKKEVSKPFLVSEHFNSNKQTTKQREEKFSVSFVKPKLFQKNSESNATDKSVEFKPNQTKFKNNTESLKNEVSEHFNSNKQTTKQSEDKFSVSFVKPKLFQKNSELNKANKSVEFKPKQTKFKKKTGSTKNDKEVSNVNDKSDDLEEFKGVHKNAAVSGEIGAANALTQEIKSHGGAAKTKKTEVVDLDESTESFVHTKGILNQNRGSALFKEGAWKNNKSTNKWFSSEVDRSGQIQVDFSTPAFTKKKPNKVNDVTKKETLNRKLEQPDRDGHAKRQKVGFGTKEQSKPVGQMSSLFSYDTVAEPLEETDVKPWEERLFSKKTFKDIGVHPHLVGNLEQLFGITNMTVVQKKTIPELINGKDALVRSQTGSGKTLAYAVPIMHNLQQITPQLTRKDGIKALIVLPTRELALQTYECFIKLMRAFTWIVPGVFIGGEKRKSEKVRLRKGITVLIGTPGRLLDHAEHSENLSFHGIDWLIIDEADKLLEMGYEKDISQLMHIIDSHREKADVVGRKQTVLLSATLTSAVEKLANVTLKDPVHIDACNHVEDTTDIMVIPQTLEQKYVVVPAKLRLVALASFIIEVTEMRKTNKVLVFMATQDMVDFYMDLIPSVLSSGVKFFKLHGNMSQGDRTEVFNSFRKSEKGVLLSTDVAARGLDLPLVDWIVQYTAPTTPAEYVHRVGRTARVGATGSSLLFLLPSELHFVSMLNTSRIKLDEVNVDMYLKCLLKIHLESKDGQRWGGGIEGAATVLQHNFEHAVIEDKTLHEIACKAYKSWVRFYATYPKDLRVVFDFKSLHLGHNAKSFALRDPPKAIGGIGKPQKSEKWGRKADMRPIRKRKNDNLGHVSEMSRTKKLILSEFDSGLKSFKKAK